MERKNKEKKNKKESQFISIDQKNKELSKKLEECQRLKEEYLSGWQRARADFLNYKKEEMERMEQILKYANQELILKILPILDNINIAEKEIISIEHKETKIKEIIKGFLQIKTQFEDFLKQQGVEEIKCLGEKFDPNFHEAIEELEVKDKEQGIIIEKVQKGYKLNGKVIRPARVKIIK
ncbi:MAG: Protein GrpE [candidate division WS2 bacterium]|nr:Protein GrpE [Candidatus Psychracetigena formicireducens]